MRFSRVRGRGRWSLTTRVLLVGTVLAVAIAAIFVLRLVSIRSLERANGARARAARVIDASSRTEKAILDMETGIRGYLLTRQRGFLEPWYQGRAAFRPRFAQLAQLLGHDRSRELPLVSAIGRQGTDYIAAYGERLLGARLARVERRIVAVTAEGKRRVDALRVLFSMVNSLSNADAQSRVAAANAADQRARTGAFVDLGAALLLIALSAFYLVRSVSRPIRHVADAADRLSAGELSVRSAEVGPGEVCRLGRSFNEMAVTIEEGSRALRSQNDELFQARAAAERTATEMATQQLLAVDVMATANLDGYFTRVNPAWERTLGFTEAELISRPFLEFVHPEDRERTAAEAAKLAESGTDTLHFENRYRTKTGTYRWIEWNVRPVVELGVLFCVGRDTTERREAEEALRLARAEAERANLAKSEFLSRMSHELRTPLNAILGFGQLLEMDGLGPRHGESVDQILSAGRHLLSLIDEVLDISRIEAGTMRISVEPEDVISALRNAVALISPVAEQAGVTLAVDAGGTDACFVRADRQRLRQVILNLLSNAVKYNRAGGSVTVSVDCDSDWVRVDVADTGAGIDPDKLERLFVAFDRLDIEQGDVPGTGLGLALSKSLVELMGGTIAAQSSPGAGSVFTVELPAAPDPVDRFTLARARQAGQRLHGVGARTILHIEDNPSNAKLVEHAFAGQPEVRLLLAMQGGTGVELAKAHHPDLILLDLHLPDMDGSAVLDRLKADPETAKVPVVVLSADATQGQLHSLLQAGASDYLTKPLDIAEFLIVVGKHLPEGDQP